MAIFGSDKSTVYLFKLFTFFTSERFRDFQDGMFRLKSLLHILVFAKKWHTEVLFFEAEQHLQPLSI